MGYDPGMRFVDKGVGFIRPGSKTRVERTSTFDTGGRLAVVHGEHWSGRVDVDVHPTFGGLYPTGRLVRDQIGSMRAEHVAARGGVSGGASGLYGQTQLDILDATQLAVNFASDAFKCQLHNGLTESYDTDALKSDLNGEVSPSGSYATGGENLASLSLTISSGSIVLDAADKAYTAATISATHAVILDDTLTNDPLFCALAFGSTVTSTAGTFTVVMGTPGFWVHDYTP